MKLTKQNIKDLQWVLDLAASSEYLDSVHDKVCERVQKLINQLKKENENTKKHTRSIPTA